MIYTMTSLLLSTIVDVLKYSAGEPSIVGIGSERQLAMMAGRHEEAPHELSPPKSHLAYSVVDSEDPGVSTSMPPSSVPAPAPHPGPVDARTSTGDDPEGRLIKYVDDRHLFDTYDRRKRPVKDHRRPVNITFTMTLYQLLEVNEPQEYIMLNVWMAHMWYDEHLCWDPELFGNITYMVLPWNQVWLSDIVLYNGLGMNHEENEKRINVELTMNPADLKRVKVRFAFPAMYKFSCKMDVYYFPNDLQNCTMVFGSWVYDVRYVDVLPADENVYMADFLKNQAWEVHSFTAYRHQYNYSCCPFPFSSVHYHFVMQRKPLFFIANLVVPTIIVAWISFIGFFMPGHSGSERTEKVNLGISTCLAMSILLLMVADKMPTASTHIPIMAWFFITIIVMVAMAIFLSTVVIIIHRQWRFGRRIPRCLRRIFFDGLAKVTCTQIPDSVREKYRRRFKESISAIGGGGGAGGASRTTRFGKAGSGIGSLRLHAAKGKHDGIIEEQSELLIRSGSSKLLSASSTDGSMAAVATTAANGGFIAPPPLAPVARRLSSSSCTRCFDEEMLASGEINEWEVLADIIERFFLILFSVGLMGMSSLMLFSIFYHREHNEILNGSH